MSDRLPDIGQQVVLANVKRHKSEDALGCHKDVGVLKQAGGVLKQAGGLLSQAGGLYWSTQGETRAMRSDAFTHWLPITEPQASDGDVG